MQDGHLNMWIGTRDSAGFHNSSSKITIHKMTGCWLDGRLAEDRRGIIWIGTSNGLVI